MALVGRGGGRRRHRPGDHRRAPCLVQRCGAARSSCRREPPSGCGWRPLWRDCSRCGRHRLVAKAPGLARSRRRPSPRAESGSSVGGVLLVAMFAAIVGGGRELPSGARRRRPRGSPISGTEDLDDVSNETMEAVDRRQPRQPTDQRDATRPRRALLRGRRLPVGVPPLPRGRREPGRDRRRGGDGPDPPRLDGVRGQWRGGDRDPSPRSGTGDTSPGRRWPSISRDGCSGVGPGTPKPRSLSSRRSWRIRTFPRSREPRSRADLDLASSGEACP